MDIPIFIADLPILLLFFIYAKKVIKKIKISMF